MKSVRILLLATVASAACSVPFAGGGSSAESSTTSVAAADSIPPRPVVQAREYAQSAVINVLGWDANDAAIGLSTAVTRSGELSGGRQRGDHRLYMTPLVVEEMGGFKYASIDFRHQLLPTPTERDAYACFYGRDCSPTVTLGVRVPDSLLRANKDSLVVTFFPTVLRPWKVLVPREVVNAYLKKVDSVVAAVRFPAADVGVRGSR